MGWQRRLGPLVLVTALVATACAAGSGVAASHRPDQAGRLASAPTAAASPTSATAPGPSAPAADPSPSGTVTPVTSSDPTIVGTISPGPLPAPTTGPPTTGAEPTSGGPATSMPGPVAAGLAAAPAEGPEAIGDLALARIGYPVAEALAGWTIEFKPGRPGLLGGTYTRRQRIEIYVRDGQAVDEIAFTLAHEIGHAVDLTYLTTAERQSWKVARGIDPSVPWWAGSGVSDYASGSGDWAESFAIWQVGGTGLSQLGGTPTAGQLELMAALSAG